MNDALVSIGAITFLICFMLLIVSLIVLIVSAFIKDSSKQIKVRDKALKVLLISLIGGIVGFGVCASNFSLGPIH